MKHFCIVVDRMSFIEFLAAAIDDVTNVDSGSVVELGFGDAAVHFVVVDECESEDDCND